MTEAATVSRSFIIQFSSTVPVEGAATIDSVDDNWEGPVGGIATSGEVMDQGSEAGMGELAISVGVARGAVACTGLAGIGA